MTDATSTAKTNGGKAGKAASAGGPQAGAGGSAGEEVLQVDDLLANALGGRGSACAWALH